MPSDFSLDHVKENSKESLCNLKTDYLDVYQLHSPNKDSLKQIEESMPWLIKKKKWPNQKYRNFC